MSYDLDLLDFGNIRRVLQQYAQTPYGKELLANLEPAPNINIARQMQACVTNARALIDQAISPVLEDVPNCRAALKQAGNPGAVLNSQAFANLMRLINAARDTKAFVAQYTGLLPGEYENFSVPEDLCAAIDKAITEAGRLKPDASEKLAALYDDIATQKESTLQKARQLIKDENLKPYLDKSNAIHWHGDHLVLLVEPTHLDKIKGVIKGSQSGGKLQMVEPMILLAENNKLEKLSQAIYAEQQTILRNLSGHVSREVIALLQIIDAITWVDTVFAAAKLSELMNASPPTLMDDNVVCFREVYHPTLLIQFLQGTIQRPVPVSVEINKSGPFILITGPNTGGKTVVLKTVGLLQIMAQCGLHIPSESDCVTGWFDTIMVDMGDRQSMYHQLSTFAGHIEVMKSLLQNSKEGALFLLDELGTGTDPEEGAAIAMAMIDTLIESGAFGIVNTHLPQLKPYAREHDKVQHAAMLFDEATLKPNYQLKFGTLGQSLGLVIAKSNGLPENVIDSAQRYFNKIATRS